MNINQKLGQKIKAIRLSKNFSQKIIADKIKVSIPNLSQIESGKVNINVSKLQQIADGLDVSITDLFAEKSYLEMQSIHRIEKESLFNQIDLLTGKLKNYE